MLILQERLEVETLVNNRVTITEILSYYGHFAVYRIICFNIMYITNDDGFIAVKF